MHEETKQHYAAYKKQVAKLNNVRNATEQFNVVPSVQQTMEKQIQDSDDFLKLINFHGVRLNTGQKIGMGVGKSLAGRTDVSQKDRETRGVGTLKAQDYVLHETDYDTHITYAQLDAWAMFPDFQTNLRDMVLHQIGLDRLKIGFNGVMASANTDPVKYPLLQDVNIGWLQQYRLHAPQRVMKETKAGSGVVRVGKGVGKEDGFKNLSALVFDAIRGMIHPAFKKDKRLRVILSPDLHDSYLNSILNRDHQPTEQKAAEEIISTNLIGLRDCIDVAEMPEGTMLITPPQNLSFYYQIGSVRRHLTEAPKRRRIEDYRSGYEGFIVEQYEAGCLIENIRLED